MQSNSVILQSSNFYEIPSFEEFSKGVCEFSYSAKIYISTKFEEVAEIARPWVKSIRIGVVVGVMTLSISMIIGIAFHFFGYVPVANPEYHEFITSELFYISVTGPIIEELIFRGGLQGMLKWVGSKLLPDITVPIYPKCQIKLAALVSVVATSILFGALHYFGGGLIQVCATTVGGFIFGVVRECRDFTASTTAHMTNNSVIALLILASRA